MNGVAVSSTELDIDQPGGHWQFELGYKEILQEDNRLAGSIRGTADREKVIQTGKYGKL
jgi:hypothetical protein